MLLTSMLFQSISRSLRASQASADGKLVRRIAFQADVLIIDGHERSLPAKLLHLSRAGLGLQVAEPLKTGERVVLNICSDTARYSLGSEVCECKKQADHYSIRTAFVWAEEIPLEAAEVCGGGRGNAMGRQY